MYVYLRVRVCACACTYPAEGGPVIGSFTAQGPFVKGQITFLWDNSYSKLTGKTVSFKLAFE